VRHLEPDREEKQHEQINNVQKTASKSAQLCPAFSNDEFQDFEYILTPAENAFS